MQKQAQCLRIAFDTVSLPKYLCSLEGSEITEILHEAHKGSFTEMLMIMLACYKLVKYSPSGKVLYWPNLFSGFQVHWWLAFHLDKHALYITYSIFQVLFSQPFPPAALLEPKGNKVSQ